MLYMWSHTTVIWYKSECALNFWWPASAYQDQSDVFFFQHSLLSCKCDVNYGNIVADSLCMVHSYFSHIPSADYSNFHSLFASSLFCLLPYLSLWMLQSCQSHLKLAMAKCLGRCHQELKPSQVLQFFECSPTGCGLPPVMPNGGEIYLFCPGEDDTKKGIHAQMIYCKTSTLQMISSFE